MPVKHSPIRRMLQVSAAIACAALLSACAVQPRISAQQESSDYRMHAGHSYTPPGPASDPWGPYIKEASAKFDVPERWVREVMRQESGGRQYGRSGDLVTSGAGAMGLMQVMPATYDEIRVRYPDLGADPYDPHNNILAGTAYIREMYDIYGSPGFLAAYNAGPGRLDDYLTRNRALPEETRRYVAAIGPRIADAAPVTASPGQQFALNAVPFTIPEGPRYAGSTRYAAMAPSQPIVLNTANPIRLAPQPEPMQFAALPVPPATPIVLRPQPVQVAQLPEPPRPAPLPVQVAQLPQPPALPPASRKPSPRPSPRRAWRRPPPSTGSRRTRSSSSPPPPSSPWRPAGPASASSPPPMPSRSAPITAAAPPAIGRSRSEPSPMRAWRHPRTSPPGIMHGTRFRARTAA